MLLTISKPHESTREGLESTGAAKLDGNFIEQQTRLLLADLSIQLGSQKPC